MKMILWRDFSKIKKYNETTNQFVALWHCNYILF